jgi:hypothetical protein
MMLGNQLGDARNTSGEIFAQLIDPESAYAPAEALKLQISPIVIVFPAAAGGAVYRLAVDFDVQLVR